MLEPLQLGAGVADVPIDVIPMPDGISPLFRGASGANPTTGSANVEGGWLDELIGLA
jgi:hypothetical protein